MPRRSRSSLRAGARAQSRRRGRVEPGRGAPDKPPLHGSRAWRFGTPAAMSTWPSRSTSPTNVTDVEPRRRGTAGAIYARCGDDRSPPMPPRKRVALPPSSAVAAGRDEQVDVPVAVDVGASLCVAEVAVGSQSGLVMLLVVVAGSVADRSDEAMPAAAQEQADLRGADRCPDSRRFRSCDGDGPADSVGSAGGVSVTAGAAPRPAASQVDAGGACSANAEPSPGADPASGTRRRSRRPRRPTST